MHIFPTPSIQPYKFENVLPAPHPQILYAESFDRGLIIPIKVFPLRPNAYP